MIDSVYFPDVNPQDPDPFGQEAIQDFLLGVAAAGKLDYLHDCLVGEDTDTGTDTFKNANF
jgi:hypothetical protein